MYYLSLLLDKAAEEGKFGYHYACKETKLTHLCFADDLLIFCDGSLRSVKNVFEVLDNFKALSGLSVSISKTCFFRLQGSAARDRADPLAMWLDSGDYSHPLLGSTSMHKETDASQLRTPVTASEE